jgi:integrase
VAHIEQRPAGWRAQIRRKGAPSISRTFDLKADAEAWAREIEREYQRGNIAALRNDAGRVTIGEVGKLYLEKVVPKKKDHSAGTYAAKARDKFGAFFLANVRSIDVAAWRDDLLDEGYSPQTVVHHLNALSALFGYAEREMSIALPTGNPVKAIAKPRQPKARDRRLRAGELDYLLRATEGARAVGVREIIILAVETSMRLDELLSLDWSRIDIEKSPKAARPLAPRTCPTARTRPAGRWPCHRQPWRRCKRCNGTMTKMARCFTGSRTRKTAALRRSGSAIWRGQGLVPEGLRKGRQEARSGLLGRSALP